MKGKVGQALRDNETRFTLVVLPVAVSLLLVMALGVYPDAGEAVRTALFEVSSAMTTAGLTRSDYGLWLDFGWMLIIVLMVIGGSTDSTAGAIKHERVVILVRSVIWEVRRAFSPEQMVNEPTFKSADGTVVITEKLVRQVALFGFFYIGLLAIVTLIIAAHGYPLRDSLFEFASAIGTTGLSSGISGADAPASVHWTLIVGMFVGRLEILAVVIGLGKLLNDLQVLLFSDET
ncbi:MAG: potassium transporter TrkG [Anaerolineae bacterium]